MLGICAASLDRSLRFSVVMQSKKQHIFGEPLTLSTANDDDDDDDDDDSYWNITYLLGQIAIFVSEDFFFLSLELSPYTIVVILLDTHEHDVLHISSSLSFIIRILHLSAAHALERNFPPPWILVKGAIIRPPPPTTTC